MSNWRLAIGFTVFFIALDMLTLLACAQQDSPEEAREEENRAIILRVYDELFVQGKTEVVNELFSKNYIQHNPAVPNGTEGITGYVEMLKSLDPAPVLTVKHILADGDFVVVHTHSSAEPDNESTGEAGFDLFRLDNGTIVEHWDMTQNVSTKTASGNSMFSDLYQYINETQNQNINETQSAAGVKEITEEQEEANKQLVVNAYEGLFNGRQLGLLDQLWAGAGYIQHNPQVPNGTEALKANFDAIFPEGSRLKIYHAVADGDLVFTHSQGLGPGDDQNSEFTGNVIGDLFRVVDGKIVEHWDVIQPVPATSASENSMFSDLYRKGGAQ